MSEEGTWGDGTMLSAAAILYGKQIMVYQDNCSPISIADTLTIKDPYVIKLGYINKDHYVSLKPKNSSTPQSSQTDTDAISRPVDAVGLEPNRLQACVAHNACRTNTEHEEGDRPREIGSMQKRPLHSSSPMKETAFMPSPPTDLGALDEPPVQPKKSEYCPRMYGLKLRDFKSLWFVGRHWLEFSLQSNAAFCYCCRHFAVSSDKADHAFIRVGFTNWKSALESGKGFGKHASSVSHVQAMSIWNDRKLRSERACKVSTMLDEHQVHKNRYYLKAAFDVMKFLCVNELPMRGHGTSRSDNIWDTSDEEPSGLFLKLFQYTMNKDSKLQTIAKSIPHNATYTSVMFQNEVIDLLSSMVRKAIVANINSADIPFFTLKSDGTRDPTNTENVSIVIRYVKDAVAYEDLLAMPSTDKLDATSMCDTILNTVLDCGLHKSSILAQCYDGASVMSGKNGGVQRLVSNSVGRTVPYVHCFNHQLHLVVVHVMRDIPQVQQYFGICDALYNFLRRPTVAILYEGETLKRLMDQRWSGHLATTAAILDNYSSVIDVLRACSGSDVVDAVTGIEASGLLKSVANNRFQFIAYAVREILELLHPADKLLQGRQYDLLSAFDVIRETTKLVEKMRSQEHVAELLAKVREHEVENVVPPPTVKRKKAAPRRLADCVVESTTGSADCAVQACDDSTSYLTRIYYAIIDNCVGELRERFGELNSKIAYAVKCLWPKPQMDDQPFLFLQPEDIKPIAELMAVDVSSPIVRSECTVARQLLVQKFCDENHTNLQDICQLLLPFKDAFPTVYGIYAAALSLGVSTATCEASFSALTRILTAYRRSMTHNRKANLVLLSFQRRYTEAVEFDHF